MNIVIKVGVCRLTIKSEAPAPILQLTAPDTPYRPRIIAYDVRKIPFDYEKFFGEHGILGPPDVMISVGPIQGTVRRVKIGQCLLSSEGL